MGNVVQRIRSSEIRYGSTATSVRAISVANSCRRYFDVVVVVDVVVFDAAVVLINVL